ncbi:hypothetical protein MVEN_01840400 [Mycena venus]|uniref:Uncharacterized protein n=1 Tax=Mycena venus TaxID=2733690 RepID=A0A8H7CLW7_9AGAR|nr:hypothetical protein MVEN_01840400 [Mycena venus]
MARQLKSALTNVFSSPRLEAVHLRGIALESPRQLLSLFSEATALNQLSLSQVDFSQQDQPEPWPESQPWRPRLRSLLVADLRYESDPFIRYLVHPQIDLSAVKSLTIAAESKESKDKILQATKVGSGGVEHLRVQWNQPPDINQHHFGANLRSIHFHTISLFRLLEAFFRACPHDSGVQHVTFEGYGHPECDDAGIEATVAHLQFLDMVHIMGKTTGRFGTFSAWTEAARAAVPSLVRRGKLRMTKSDRANDGWQDS